MTNFYCPFMGNQDNFPLLTLMLPSTMVIKLTFEVVCKSTHNIPINPEAVDSLANCHWHTYQGNEKIRNAQVDQKVVGNANKKKNKFISDTKETEQ